MSENTAMAEVMMYAYKKYFSHVVSLLGSRNEAEGVTTMDEGSASSTLAAGVAYGFSVVMCPPLGADVKAQEQDKNAALDLSSWSAKLARQ
jgi:hypothetical protein